MKKIESSSVLNAAERSRKISSEKCPLELVKKEIVLILDQGYFT